MPWKIVSDHAGCPKARPWAVVKEGTDEVKGCHTSSDAAKRQLAALNAAESSVAAADSISLIDESSISLDSVSSSSTDTVTINTPAASGADSSSTDLSAAAVAVDDEPSLGEPALPATFRSVLVPENEDTSDGRFITPGALTWRTLPLPLMFQPTNEGRHQGSVIVGRIETVERVGSEIHATGTFDLGSEMGREAARQVRDQIQRWVSVDMEIIEDELLEDGDSFRQVIHSARLSGATIVVFPAFPSAVIVPGDAELPAATPDGRPAAATITSPATRSTVPVAFTQEVHHAAISEVAFDPSTDRYDLQSWVNACAAFEALSDSIYSDHYLPHHEPSGAISRRGLYDAALRLRGLRRRNTEAARAHLLDHFRADLKEPVPHALDDASLVASAARLPLLAWFADPALVGPTPITLTRDGRIYGHAALWDACHISHPNSCVTPPRSRTSYAYFMTGETEVADPETLTVAEDDCSCATRPSGPITMGTSHAHLAASASRTKDHYENTGAAVADVAVGEDAYGIWVSGSLRPTTSAAQRAALRGSSLSGDWRRIGGALELVALLAVNVPGFPVPRIAAASIGGTQVSLVAAGNPAEVPDEDPIGSGASPADLLAALRSSRSSDDDAEEDEASSDADAPSDTDDVVSGEDDDSADTQ